MLFGKLGSFAGFAVSLVLCPLLFGQQAQSSDVGSTSIPLQVESGTPLRLYITKRVWYRDDEIVQAKFAEPVWAFDRIVIPAGTTVEGKVADLKPVPKTVRAMSMVRGDFTPLKRAQVRFTTVHLTDGRSIMIDAGLSAGLGTIFEPARPSKKPARPPKKTKAKAQPQGPPTKSAQIRSFLKQQLKQQAQTQASARTGGLLDLVRGPNKREWVENFLWSKLPYHPQFYRSGTRFDAVLEKPLDFGEVKIADTNLRQIGAQPPPDSPAMVRLLSTLSSADAHIGDPITGVLSQPVFSPSHEIVLPEGTRLTGKITLARPARMFHRGGQLRFAFSNVEVPIMAMTPAPRLEPAQAQLTAAEQDSGPVQVDSEGTAKATESKARFLRPVIAGLVAAKSMDNDAGKQNASGGADANFSGRSLGGFSGFGLFGAAIARGPRPIGSALGFYGLAWSAYSTVISRGREVVFEKNTAMSIRFGSVEKRK